MGVSVRELWVMESVRERTKRDDMVLREARVSNVACFYQNTGGQRGEPHTEVPDWLNVRQVSLLVTLSNCL